MLTERIQKAKNEYVNNKPSISYERARIWTESYKRTEGQTEIVRRAQAFKDVCRELVVTIFPGELIVGASGEFRKCGILTPEFFSAENPKDRFCIFQQFSQIVFFHCRPLYFFRVLL